MNLISIRQIRPDDDIAMATIIRTVMPEFGAGGDGFAIKDPEVDWMSRAYSEPRSAYFVVERDGQVEGGGGVAPLSGGDAGTCELRKMYFLPSLRRLGAGAAVMTRCLETARGFGFHQCYLETLFGMDSAMRLYEKTGFARLPGSLGDTGHGGCDTFYLLRF